MQAAAETLGEGDVQGNTIADLTHDPPSKSLAGQAFVHPIRNAKQAKSHVWPCNINSQQQ